MKERIVIEDKEVKEICDDCIMSENCKKKNTYEQARCCFNFQFIPANIEIEQVPETFKEFKEMCKIEDISECDDEVKIQWHNNTCLYFYEKNGEIICKDEDSCIEMIIGYDRSPQQMWETIESLGKEK